jgi:hypothetical protein
LETLRTAIRVTARLMASSISGLGSLFTASVSGAGFLSLPASPTIFAWRLADSFKLLPKRIRAPLARSLILVEVRFAMTWGSTCFLRSLTSGPMRLRISNISLSMRSGISLIT